MTGGPEHLRQWRWKTCAQGSFLLCADGCISSRQMMQTLSQRASSSAVASGKRWSRLAVTRRYRRKSDTRFLKLRNVQYRSRTCRRTTQHDSPLHTSSIPFAIHLSPLLKNQTLFYGVSGMQSLPSMPASLISCDRKVASTGWKRDVLRHVNSSPGAKEAHNL